MQNKSLVDTAPAQYYNSLNAVNVALDQQNYKNAAIQKAISTKGQKKNQPFSITDILSLIMGRPKIISPIPE